MLRPICTWILIYTLICGIANAFAPTFDREVVGNGRFYGVHYGDLDNDGDLDIVAAHYGGDRCVMFLNDGKREPSFTASNLATGLDNCVAVWAADIDSDGDLDVATASESDDKIVWHENDGSSPPSFTSHVLTTSANRASDVTVGDINNDGRQDIIYSAADSNQVGWFENNGAGFTHHTLPLYLNYASSVDLADMDSDADLDIVVTCAYADKLSWLKNNGGGVSFTQQIVDTTSGVRPLDGCVSDLDGDALPDLIEAAHAVDRLYMFINQGGRRRVLAAIPRLRVWTMLSAWIRQTWTATAIWISSPPPFLTTK